MTTISRLSLAGLALGVAVLAASAARAESSEAMGLQAVAEAMHQEAIRNGDTGWRNGEARLVTSGTGYGIAYSGMPQGDVGRGALKVVGSMDGKLMVEYADTAPHPATMLAQRR